MKKTEDIVDYNLREILDIAVMNSSYCRNILIRVVKQAQIDAIKETCERCSESASFEYANYRYEIPDLVPYVGDDEYGYRYIDKNSILSVADELIKEL